MPRNYGTDLNLNKNALMAARFEVLPTAPTAPALAQQYFDSTLKQFRGFNGTDWIDLSQVISNPVTLKGEIANAASNPAYPAVAAIGDTYMVTTQGGTIGGQAVEIGDELVYSNSGWFVLQRNLQAATQAIAGFARFATQAEANQGSDPALAMSPATLAAFLIGFLYARKFRGVIGSLVAGTATPLTHGLNVANPEDVHVSFYQGGAPLELAWTATSVNAITVTANQAYTNLTAIILG